MLTLRDAELESLLDAHDPHLSSNKNYSVQARRDRLVRSPQLFSDLGEEWNPFLGLDHFSGATQKKGNIIGATEQLSPP